MIKNSNHFRRDRKIQICKRHFPRYFCLCKHLTARKKRGCMHGWNKISARRVSLSFGNPLVHLETNLSYVQSSWIWDASSRRNLTSNTEVNLLAWWALEQWFCWQRAGGLGWAHLANAVVASIFCWGDPGRTEFTEAVAVCFQLGPTICWKERMGFDALCCAFDVVHQPEKLICKCNVMWVCLGASISYSC